MKLNPEPVPQKIYRISWGRAENRPPPPKFNLLDKALRVQTLNTILARVLYAGLA